MYFSFKKNLIHKLTQILQYNKITKCNSKESDVCLSVHRCICVEKKTNYMLLNDLLHL